MKCFVAMFLLGCGSGDWVADTGTLTEFCDDAPLVSWENFGNGLVVERCQSCHASTTENRNGAPVDIHFDTEEATLSHAERILLRVVEEQTMPPQGGIEGDDLERIELWLRCSEGVAP